MGTTLEASKQVFIYTPHEDLFNALLNWYRQDFHSIHIKSFYDIHSYVHKGIMPGVMIVDTDIEDDLKEVCKKIRRIFPLAPIVILPKSDQRKDYESYVENKLADLILTSEDIFFEHKHILLFAYKNYNASLKLMKMQKEKNDLNHIIKLFQERMLVAETLQNSDVYKKIMRIITTYPLAIEKYYLNNHLRSTNLTIKVLCESLLLDNEQIIKAIASNYLYNYILSSMPDYFATMDPDMMPKEFRELFFIEYLEKIKILQMGDTYTEIYYILKEVWEHYDGSGFPQHLSGNAIIDISQIIFLANRYHNLYARVTEKDLRHIIEHGSKHYEIDELNNRFDFAKKYIMQSSKNFAPEILHVFQENIRKKDYISFIPLHQTFTIYHQYTPHTLKIFNAILEKQAEKEAGITENQKAENISVGKTDKTKVESQTPKPTTISSRNTATLPHTSIKSAEKELKAKQSKYENNMTFNAASFSSKKQPIRPQLVEQLEAGDILMETIKNKFGGVMVKEGTVLTARTIALLNDMAKKESIPNQVIINTKTRK